MDEKQEMTAERSLEIIIKMVESTRQRVEANAWKPMLYWGLCTIALALLVGYLWQNTKLGAAANLLWIGVCLIAIYPLVRRHEQSAVPSTYLSKAIGAVWTWFGIICGLLGLIWGSMGAIGKLFVYLPSAITINHNFVMPITGVVIMLMGLGSTITGSMLKINSITVCGVITTLLGGTFGLIIIGPQQMVFLALCLFVSLVIPALIIRKKDKSTTNQ